MTKFRPHYALVTISAALALTLDAVPAAAYQQLSRDVLVYRSPGAADDLPAPPKMSGAPRRPQPALNGYGHLTMNGTHVGNRPSAPPGKGLGAADTHRDLHVNVWQHQGEFRAGKYALRGQAPSPRLKTK